MTTMAMTPTNGRMNRRTSQPSVTDRVRTMVMSAGLAAIVAVSVAASATAMFGARSSDASSATTNVQPVPERAPVPQQAPGIVSERYYGV